MTATVRPQTARMDIPSAQAYLYHEARLLDENRLDEWLELFAPDSLYWLPIGDGQAERPEDHTALIRDTDVRRRERVYRLQSTPLPSQRPPSRILHLVSNVELESATDDEARVRSVQLIAELRVGDYTQRGLGDQRLFLGHCTHDLVLLDGYWRIRRKKLVLITRDVSVPNLTFLL